MKTNSENPPKPGLAELGLESPGQGILLLSSLACGNLHKSELATELGSLS